MHHQQQGHPNRITKVEEGEVGDLSEAEQGRMAVERGTCAWLRAVCSLLRLVIYLTE